MILIVDGYNMIGAWPELSRQTDFDKARLDLLDMMADYAGFSGDEVTVVFDGHQSGRIRRHVERHAGVIDVVFTRDGETADHYIERMVDEKTAHLPRMARPIVRVATSDAIEQTVVLSRGAVRVSAMELRRELRASRGRMNDTIQRRAPVKPDALEGRVGRDAFDFLEALRQRDEEEPN